MRQIKQNIKWENPDAAVVNAGIEQITNFLILKAIYKICKTIVLHMQIIILKLTLMFTYFYKCSMGVFLPFVDKEEAKPNDLAS